MSMSRNFNMLSAVTIDKDVKKLDCLIDIGVASDDEFARGSDCMGKN